MKLYYRISVCQTLELHSEISLWGQTVADLAVTQMFNSDERSFGTTNTLYVAGQYWMPA